MQEAFIRKNTAELRQELEKLGYINQSFHDIRYADGLSTYYHPNLKKAYTVMCPNRGIDCHENEDLFLAIAALNDNNDYMQWFTDGNIFIKSEHYKFHFMGINPNNVEEYYDYRDKFHKATVDELIDYFTNYEPQKVNWDEKRFELIKAAVQGLCANGLTTTYERLAEFAIEQADAVIKKLK